jgi:hypothetical protein
VTRSIRGFTNIFHVLTLLPNNKITSYDVITCFELLSVDRVGFGRGRFDRTLIVQNNLRDMVTIIALVLLRRTRYSTRLFFQTVELDDDGVEVCSSPKN